MSEQLDPTREGVKREKIKNVFWFILIITYEIGDYEPNADLMKLNRRIMGRRAHVTVESKLTGKLERQ